MPTTFIVFSLSWFAGFAIYSVYHDCDPFKAGLTHRRDELVPFFIIDKLDYLYGVTGLFLAAIFFSSLM